MLQAIRGKSASIIVKILLGLLILSFGAWGINDYIGVSFNDRAPVLVGGKEVPTAEIDRPFREQVSRLQQQLGGNFTYEDAMAIGLLDQVIARIATRTALDRYVEEVGLVSSEETLKSALRQTSEFQGADGTFDRHRFESALFQSGLTQEVFLSQLQQDIVHQQFLAAVSRGIEAPEAMVNNLFRYREEQRVVDLLEQRYNAVSNVPQPSETDLAEHLIAFAEDFQTPEYRDVVVLALTPETVARDVLLTDDDLRTAYQQRQVDYTTPERRTVRQIVLPDQEAARSAADRILGGETFNDVALTLAAMEPADTEMGSVTRNDLFGPTAEAVFNTLVGGITQPVETAFGWHVFLIENSEPGTVREFEEVKEELRETLIRERALDVVFDLINDVEEIQAGGGTAQEIAGELNLQTYTVRGIARGGALETGETPADLPVALNDIANAAFSTAEGETSSAEQVGEAGFVMVDVTGITPPTTPDLNVVRDRVAASWRTEQQRDLALDRSEDVAEALRGGKTVEQVAEEFNLTLRNSPAFKRTGEGLATLPRSIAGAAFTLNKGDVGIAEGPEAAYILVLTEVQEPNLSAQNDALANLSTALNDALRGSIQGSIATAVVDRYPVEVDRDALQRLYGDRGAGYGGMGGAH